QGDELLVITRAYELVREMSARADKLPRARKYYSGETEFDKVRASVASSVAHLGHGDTHGPRRSLLEWIVCKGPA
ncbi:MAG: hypothetical protein JW940_27255, partial [Polyangiaceae bacterium]|nr:hypothetical protein [Polyangiaceae bacterium]